MAVVVVGVLLFLFASVFVVRDCEAFTFFSRSEKQGRVSRSRSRRNRVCSYRRAFCCFLQVARQDGSVIKARAAFERLFSQQENFVSCVSAPYAHTASSLIKHRAREITFLLCCGCCFVFTLAVPFQTAGLADKSAEKEGGRKEVACAGSVAFGLGSIFFDLHDCSCAASAMRHSLTRSGRHFSLNRVRAPHDRREKKRGAGRSVVHKLLAMH